MSPLWLRPRLPTDRPLLLRHCNLPERAMLTIKLLIYNRYSLNQLSYELQIGPSFELWTSLRKSLIGSQTQICGQDLSHNSFYKNELWQVKIK